MSADRAHTDKGKTESVGERFARNDRRHLTPSQYERLLKIIALLLPRYYYPYKDLARELGISTRTLQRDIASLQERGVIITQERGGYRCPSKQSW